MIFRLRDFSYKWVWSTGLEVLGWGRVFRYSRELCLYEYLMVQEFPDFGVSQGVGSMAGNVVVFWGMGYFTLLSGFGVLQGSRVVGLQIFGFPDCKFRYMGFVPTVGNTIF